ncbi:hypothetical protein [Xanthomonas campestris]|jgi:hypothetical protein|nr:hypothetical protein [Xanthomonas campestris]MCC3256288.1 hypothetical protein [Xanthomonas campestris pv. armoraciae]MCC5051413.1 hypothetical protein [Xanthomonas campestris pv. aberrans]MCC5078072.1 hypothetical protein [Xanthomonas campestris pv. campestris]MDM7587062.1 hypothetical protein [Xanthomonas campestris]MDM7594209.1 hypothetical protein [Xanthomonas campestris]
MKDMPLRNHAASVHAILAIARQLAAPHDGRMMQSNAVPMSAAHVCLNTVASACMEQTADTETYSTAASRGQS